MNTLSTPRRTRSGAGLLLVAAMLLTGCAGTPSTGDSAADTDTTANATDQQKMDDWNRDMASCYQKAGFDVSVMNGVLAFGADVTSAAGFEEATTKCTDEVGTPPGGVGVSNEEALKQDLAISTCLREAGYDVPDPKPEDYEKGGSPQFLGGYDVSKISQEDLSTCFEKSGAGSLGSSEVK